MKGSAVSDVSEWALHRMLRLCSFHTRKNWESVAFGKTCSEWGNLGAISKKLNSHFLQNMWKALCWTLLFIVVFVCVNVCAYKFVLLVSLSVGLFFISVFKPCCVWCKLEHLELGSIPKPLGVSDKVECFQLCLLQFLFSSLCLAESQSKG